MITQKDATRFKSGFLVLTILIFAAMSGGWAFGSEPVCTVVSVPGNFEVPTLCIDKQVVSGDLQIDVQTKEYWDIEIEVGYTDSGSLTNVVVTDTLPAEIDLVSYVNSTGTVDIRVGGKKGRGSTHITWSVGTLTPGQSETLTLSVTNNLNPSGRQRFTKLGNYTLNEGAEVEGYHAGIDEVITAGPTDPITVEVGQ